MSRLVVLLGVAGCPAISDADLQNRIDRDGDGQAAVAFGGLDCNDDDPAIFVGAPEVCDGVDNDCDGLVNADDPDADPARVVWFLDADGDGFGSELVTARSCAELPGWVHAGGDCDDTDPEQFPGQVWYLDGDGDGFGLADRVRVECSRPAAHALVAGDCSDANPEVFPGAPEVCNGGVDDDCDGIPDELDPDVVDAALVYDDLDGDGYGATDTERLSCALDDPTITTVPGDCDDADPDAHPGAPDRPYVDGDTDCSGDSDFDADGDGFDVLGSPTGGTDCDDRRSWVYPGAPEICDAEPNDCTPPASWDESLEGVQVTFVPADGSLPIDWTVPLETGGVVQVAESGVLYVCDQPSGGWTGQIEVTGGDVSVVAARGPGSSTLDGSGLGSANLVATGPLTDLEVVGLTLTGGTGVSSGFLVQGGCLYADGIDELDVLDSVIVGCSADTGGGVYARVGRLTLARTSLLDNTASLGGGASLQWELESTLSQVTFAANTATVDGGGLFANEQLDRALRIESSTFVGNVATDEGGGLYASGEVRVVDTQITGNAASVGGGIALRANGDVVRCGGATRITDKGARGRGARTRRRPRTRGCRGRPRRRRRCSRCRCRRRPRA